MALQGGVLGCSILGVGAGVGAGITASEAFEGDLVGAIVFGVCAALGLVAIAVPQCLVIRFASRVAPEPNNNKGSANQRIPPTPNNEAGLLGVNCSTNEAGSMNVRPGSKGSREELARTMDMSPEESALAVQKGPSNLSSVDAVITLDKGNSYLTNHSTHVMPVGLSPESQVEFDKLVSKLLAHREKVRELGEVGSPTNEDLQDLDDERHRYAQTKMDVVRLLNDQLASGAKVRIEGDSVQPLHSIFVGILSEGDQRESSIEFISTVLEHIDADFGSMIETESLVPQQCIDGDQHFFRLLLNYEGAKGRYDPVEVLTTACFSQSARIPLTLLYLTHVELSAEQWDEVREVIRDFVFELCTQRKLQPREEKNGRLDLLRLLLTHKMVQFDSTVESEDGGGTIWSRACFDGDVELMKLLVEVLPRAGVDSATILHDSTTPLLQAVLSKNVDALRFAYAEPGADSALLIADSDGNTPRSMAALMKREDMLAILV
eukprot:Hpha_TRINITY_DN12925_c0_g2::TRINITY_DN12925_c0_g2_i1::g.164327::m.164327